MLYKNTWQTYAQFLSIAITLNSARNFHGVFVEKLENVGILKNCEKNDAALVKTNETFALNAS